MAPTSFEGLLWMDLGMDVAWNLAFMADLGGIFDIGDVIGGVGDFAEGIGGFVEGSATSSPTSTSISTSSRPIGP